MEKRGDELYVMEIGNNIKEIRKQCGLTQKQLAEKIHVTRQVISQWETGATFPPVDRLVEMAEAFNCPVEDIVCDKRKRDFSLLIDFTEARKTIIVKLKEYKTDNEEERIIQRRAIEIAEDEMGQSEKLRFEFSISAHEKNSLRAIKEDGLEALYFLDKKSYYYLVAGQLFVKAKHETILQRMVDPKIIYKEFEIEKYLKEMLS